ncbi:uncharacterized protein C8Q71DRAFT_749060 [Rhodofomes roseus]|uniref:Uncharacterized protein n=1 Tax=Rhodofomes roseus TaxID=34475 RepID=A0A4Y9YDY9_9APHY|nr:uncharacterized protein C8Q71DRAFT_749060 [Rhodofomes roseus]KAH9839346.1 hypothetical protein C8Q71DRAFT_749060 [Rhodofomes roseus]TFY60545.1 hypothetical protein EVJ58_g5072 [Rhodofomes roseus]
MYGALKAPSFFRPTSRPSSPVMSPVPDPAIGVDRTARPLSKLSLATFRKPSPSPVPPPTRVASATVTQDGSYMDVLSLKLSEAVSKALAQPTGPGVPNEILHGRRPIPPGRGRALGALIASEIKASRDNPHLYRALLRSLQRPLSVLLSNLSSDLLPLLASPAFLNNLVPTPQNPNPNATQLHAIGLATLAGEIVEAFDGLGLGLETDMRGDGLKAIREGLVSMVRRVVEPLITGIKNELMPLLDALEANPNSPSAPRGSRSPMSHSSIMTMQGLIPVYARALGRYATSAVAENSLASLLISLIWRGLVALSNRPSPPQTPPASPTLTSTKAKDGRRAASQTRLTPPATPPASRFTLKLPPSRPPSPPAAPSGRGTSAAADCHALCDLLNLLPRPSADKESTRLAREAVDEGYEALKSLTGLLEAVQATVASSRGRAGSPAGLTELEHELENLTADLPMLIALPVLLRTFLPHIGAEQERTVSSILGLSEADYRRGCLGGFGRAEECTDAVGKRILDALRSGALVGTSEKLDVLMRWVEGQIAAANAEQH